MSFVGSMFDNAKGAGFQAKSVPLQQAVTQAQTDQAYQNTQSGLAQQQAFVNALNAQNGIGNQSNVYNQLSGIAAGQGANPAQSMLNQATGANVANQAALMASQRGSSANGGMLARQAAMQGGAIQQNAAGQGAVMQANQSLNALGQMGNISGQQVGQQQSGISNYNSAAQGQQQNLLNSVAQYNSTAAGQQANMNSANAGIAALNTQAQAKLLSGVTEGAGKIMVMAAHGGLIPPQSHAARFFNGGMPTQNMTQGGPVPGQAEVRGDSFKNDTVPAWLSPNEIVIPRSIVMGQNPGEASRHFVESQLRKNNYAEGGQVPQSQFTPESLQVNPSFMQQAMNVASNDPNRIPFPEDYEPKLNFNPQGAPVEAAAQQPQGPQNYQIPQQKQNMNSVASQLPTEEIIQKPIQEQIQGQQAEAQAKGNLGNQESALAQKQIQQQELNQKNYENSYKENFAEVKAAEEDYKNGHINPSRYIDNMSSMGKVKAAIGLILGGIGGALGGKENAASKFLDDQIGRDIESQKADMGKKNNLLAANFKKFGDMQDAVKMTQSMLCGIYATKLDQAKAKAQTPIEKARADQAAAVLRAQIAPTLQQIKVRNTLLGQDGSTQNDDQSLAVKARFLAPQDMQKEALKEVGEYQAMTKAQEKVRSAFEKLDKINTFGNRVAHGFFTPASVAAIVNPITAGLSKETAGKFTEFEAEALSHLLPSPGDTAATVADKREQVEKMIAEKMNFPTLNSIGINVGPKEYANKNQKVTPGYKTAKR